MFSAAQALLLAKTAEMNDIEYEAFRINTARTQLSEEANQLGDQMSNMDLPVPPSMSDYTNIVYSFTIGTDSVTIESVRPNNDAFNVTIRQTITDMYMERCNGTLNVTSGEDGYYIAGEQINLLSYLVENGTLASSEYEGYIQAIRNSFDDYMNQDDETILNSFYMYTDTSTSSHGVNYFMLRTDVENRIASSVTNNAYQVPYYEYIPGGPVEVLNTLNQCQLEFDTTGRITSISVPVTSNGEIVGYRNYTVTANTSSDEAGYQDAYNKYQYQKYQYDQEQSRLNHEIEVIQKQDKNLELKLTKLENKRSALKTEIDSVQKVIDDNIESSFKTFA